MNRKIVVFFGVAALTAGVFARPHGGGPHGGGHPGPHGGGHHGPHGGWHPGPRPMHYHGHHHPHHYSYWGHGGEYFWPDFVGGVVGGAIASTVIDRTPVVVASPTVVTTPTYVTQPVVVQQQPVVVQQPVVQQPVVQPQNVWVEGRYVDQVQANGSVVRVWQPGHYEQR